MSAALADALRRALDTIDACGSINMEQARATLAAWDAEQHAAPTLADALRAIAALPLSSMPKRSTTGCRAVAMAADALAAHDAAQPAVPTMLDTQAAVTSLAGDYIEQRLDPDDEKRNLEELVNEAIGHAIDVLGVNIELPRDEEWYDAIAEELTDRYTLTTDDDRSNGPRQ